MRLKVFNRTLQFTIRRNKLLAKGVIVFEFGQWYVDWCISITTRRSYTTANEIQRAGHRKSQLHASCVQQHG